MQKNDDIKTHYAMTIEGVLEFTQLLMASMNRDIRDKISRELNEDFDNPLKSQTLTFWVRSAVRARNRGKNRIVLLAEESCTYLQVHIMFKDEWFSKHHCR